MKGIINGKIYFKNEFVEGKVLVFDETIVDLRSDEDIKDLDLIDARGKMVIPGLIDVHIHGTDGKDVMDGDPESLAIIRQSIVKNGVTSFLPTTMTMDLEKIEKALNNVKENMHTKIGAKILGVHLEGPFINKKYKGAQPEEHIISPNIQLVEKYKDIIKVITIAPEAEGAIEMIKMFDINFSLGHSSTTFDKAKEAFDAGAKSVTHTFNGMTPLHHREPGLVGAALMSDCYCELIADNHHVNPVLFNFVLKNKTSDKILLITDCMRGGNSPDGDYDLGGQKVIVKDGKCYLETGSIAGSTLKLNKGLKNFVENSDLSIEEGLKLVTSNQSKYLDINNIGSLDIGNCADIVILEDDLSVLRTIVDGETVFEI